MEQESSNRQHTPKHLLVMRFSAMGDVAMLAHALRALRRNYPDLKITVATRHLFEPFFEGLNVDMLCIDTKDEHAGLRGLWKFSREILRLKVDAIADVHSVLRTRIIAGMLIPNHIKYARIQKGRIEKWFRMSGGNNTDAVPLKHTVIRYCDVLHKLGFEFDTPPERERDTTRPNPMGEKNGTWISFAPFSAHNGKTYPADLSRQVVKLLAASYQRVFIHSGGGEEAKFAEKMQSTYPNVTALFGHVTLKDEIDLLSHVDCVISMDSLVMHLSSIVGAPVVSIWGATHPKLGYMGYGCRMEDALQTELPCRPCSIYGNKRCKYGDYRCLRAITPDMVVAKVAAVIAHNAVAPVEK